MSELQDKFKKMMDLSNPYRYMISGTVVSADENTGLCAVKFSNTKIPVNKNVLLAADKGNDFLMIPFPGSKVIVGFEDNNLSKGRILSVSKIQKIILKTSPLGNLSIDLSDEGIKIKTLLGEFSLLDWCGQINKILTSINVWGQTVTPPLTLPPFLQPPIFP